MEMDAIMVQNGVDNMGAELTIFTCPKDFKGVYGMLQRNAIRSWLQLKPKPEIIIFGAEEVAAEFPDCKCVPQVKCNKYGTPLVAELWRGAEEIGHGRILAYVNADIVLLQDWLDAIAAIDLPEFVAVGKRWDWRSPYKLDFAKEWDAQLMRTMKGGRGHLHASAGIDYFIFTRELYREIPAFAVGRVAWDNWLTNYPLKHGKPLVDITESATAIHQNHQYGTNGELGPRGIWDGPEAQINKELAGFYWATTDQATHMVVSNMLRHNKTAAFTNMSFLPEAYSPSIEELREMVDVGDNKYPAYLNKGNANQFIAHIATRYCIGRGLDIGAGRWPVKLHHGMAIPVDFGQEINDGVTLPGVAPNSQDFIFSSHCLEHLTEWQNALARWFEVLRPGGRLLLFLPHPNFKPWTPGGCWVSGHMWAPEHDSLCKFLQTKGFVIEASNPGPDLYQSFHIVAQKPCMGQEPSIPSKQSVVNTSRTIVVPVRNANKAALTRLSTFTRKLMEAVKTHVLQGELILVEWNPPKGRSRILEAMEWPKCPDSFSIRIVTVPAAYHEVIYSDHVRAIYPFIALNVGAVRAHTDSLILMKEDRFEKPAEEYFRYAPTSKQAYWLFDKVLIIGLEQFTARRGFVEVAQEENQLYWLQRNLYRKQISLRDERGAHQEFGPTILTVPRTENEREATNLRARDINNGQKGIDWGMKYDWLEESTISNSGIHTAPDTPKRIAFILAVGLGDMLEAIPSVKALAQKYPKARIDWITRADKIPLIPTKYVNGVSASIDRDPGQKQITSWLADNQKKYDRIYLASAIYRRISSAHYIPHMKDLISVWCGVEVTDKRIEVDMPETNLDRFSLPEQYITLCSSPCYSCRRWGARNRQIVADRFLKAGCHIVLVGGPDGENIEGENVMNLCGKLSFHEFIAVVRNSELYIGPDTGPTWLACVAEEVPKFCILPGRVQIPTGFEGYVPGKIKDVTYATPSPEYAEMAVKFFEQNRRPAKRKKPKKITRKPRATIDVIGIVLNGEPWIQAWLDTYTPFADNIIIAEGVDNKRFAHVPPEIRKKLVTPTGHSTDNTLDILNNANADMTIITRDGGWSDKNAMFAEISKYCYSDYVFSIDMDEFWREADLKTIKQLLEDHPEVIDWWVEPMNFWKSGKYHTLKNEPGLWHNDAPVLFKWEYGRLFVHQPRHVEPPIGNTTQYFPFKLFHYNYVLAPDAEYKRHYHNEQSDWYKTVWQPWTPQNRLDLTRGIQPDGHAKITRLVEFTGDHPKYIAPVLKRLEREGLIL